MYAIIDHNGHQYKVSEKENLEVDTLPVKEGEKVVVNNVLVIADNGKVSIGNPYIVGANVVLKVIKHLKGEKIRVSRFKAKSRYQRLKGFRPHITMVSVETIGYKSKKKPVIKATK